MPRFHADGRFAGSQQPLTTTMKTQTLIYTTSNSLIRGRCVEIAVGADGAPNSTDCQIVYAIQRYTTTSGTGTAATPNPKDPADAATIHLSKVNFTAEPTYSGTLIVWSRALNQRASMQWVAPDQDAGLRWAATADVGLGAVALSPTYTGNVLAGLDWEY